MVIILINDASIGSGGSILESVSPPQGATHASGGHAEGRWSVKWILNLGIGWLICRNPQYSMKKRTSCMAPWTKLFRSSSWTGSSCSSSRVPKGVLKTFF